MLEAKVAMMMRFRSAWRNRLPTPAATFCSVAVKPGRSELVESLSSSSTPLRPYSAMVSRSVGPADSGV